MNVDAIVNEIMGIRARLDEIESERQQLPTDAFSRKADLNDEEHELRALLMRLQDATVKARDTQEIPGVPGQSPPPSQPPL